MKMSRGAQIALAQALLVAASLYVFLNGWRHDFRVPLGFSSDSLFYLMQSKGTIDNGWWWFNSLIGAPLGVNELAFPSNSNVDQSIVWLISRFVSHAGLSVNLAWASMVVLSGLSATWCMRTLGASTSSAVVAGTLFALTPYALYRNIDHFAMVIYLVPFAGTVALLLASGRVPAHGYWKGAFGLLLAGCALLAFNYVYYAFFGCFLIGLASIVGFLAHGQRRILAAGSLCLALIGGCTIVNLAPSLYVLQRDGKPTIIRDKVPAESEVYGMKIRQLVSPAFQHAFPPFRWWAQRDSAAQFPLETENMTSRLGLVATIGFLGLLGLLLVPGAADRIAGGPTLLGASQLTIAAVLLGTIGGFGSLFSLLVSPEIRAYNRISPFIAFFSLTAVALAMDALLKTRVRRLAAAAIVLALGLADQRMAASGLNAAYPPIAAEMPPLDAFVRQLEGRLPDRAMVLQLPFRTFLNDSGVARMQAYDHLKLYFVSHHIRWSYPALSNEQVRWQHAAEALNPRQLPARIAAEGFAAIVVDRYGYADNGSAIAAAIRAGLPGDSVIAQTDRYLALDVRSLAGAAGAAATVPLLSAHPVAASLAMGACGGAPLVNIEQIGAEKSPFGDRQLHVPGSNVLKVTGWAVDQQKESGAAGVDVVMDQTPFPSVYGADRRDVADYFKRPAYGTSGFEAEIPSGTIPRGPHTLSLRVVSSTGACYYETPPIAVVID